MPADATLEIKGLAVEATVDEAGAIEGIAWPFGSPDRDGDVIVKGAFAGARAPLPMLDNHNPDQVLGVWDSVAEDGEGLRVKGRLLVEDLPEAKAMRAKVKAGAIRGLSIGFRPKAATPRRGGGRTITAVDLVEVSLVPTPAHAGAGITDFKAAGAAASKEANVAETNDGAAADTAAIETKLADLGGRVDGLAKLGERLDKLEAKANRPGTGETKAEPSVERKAFTGYLRSGSNAPELDVKALRVSSDPNGGYLAPPEMATEMIRELVEYSPIRSIASVRGTANPSVIYPKRTSGTNALWKGENEDQEESGVGFGQVEIPVKEINTYVDLSNQLLQDSAVDVEAEVRMALGEDFGKKEGVAFISGDGVLQPAGFMNASGVAYTANGHATNLSADALISLMYALPATYRNRGSWVMNGGTIAIIRKLKDGQGNYLWQPSYQAGQPETILGRPVVDCVDMPDLADGTFPIVFGDFGTAYRIVDRQGLSILVNPYLLATKGMTRFHATRRVGGAVIQAAAIRKLKMATS